VRITDTPRTWNAYHGSRAAGTAPVAGAAATAPAAAAPPPDGGRERRRRGRRSSRHRGRRRSRRGRHRRRDGPSSAAAAAPSPSPPRRRARQQQQFVRFQLPQQPGQRVRARILSAQLRFALLLTRTFVLRHADTCPSRFFLFFRLSRTREYRRRPSILSLRALYLFIYFFFSIWSSLVQIVSSPSCTSSTVVRRYYYLHFFQIH